MSPRLHAPSRDDIALLPPFERLGLHQIAVVQTAAQAHAAWAELSHSPSWGFDTESKPTFFKDQASDGPHVLQLATLDKAWVIQLHDSECRAVAAQWLALAAHTKVGFGLGDDKKRIVHKLGVEPQGVLDLNAVFKRQGYRQELGVKGAVAVVLGQQFPKSKKVATSNWAQPQLSDAQVLYAANDAYGAIRVHHALNTPS